MQDVSTEHKRQVTTELGGKLIGQGGTAGFKDKNTGVSRGRASYSSWKRTHTHTLLFISQADYSSFSTRMHKWNKWRLQDTFGSRRNKSLKSKHFRKGIFFFVFFLDLNVWWPSLFLVSDPVCFTQTVTSVLPSAHKTQTTIVNRQCHWYTS